MRLPATWIAKTSLDENPRSRRYVHLETGVEVERNICGWGVGVPGRPGPKAHAGTVTVDSHFDYKTMAAALEAAETHVIPRVREVIAKAYAEAVWFQIGTPEEWTEGQAGEQTVAARHAAIRSTDRRNGSKAKRGEVVKHVETGALGIFSSWSRSVASGVYVDFPEQSTADLVHADDVVVLEGWHSCNRVDLADHAEHGEVVSAQCLTALPAAELTGPELTAVRDGHEYTATDGVQVCLHADGTWWACGPNVSGIGVESICARQDTLAATYRPINRWRRARNAQDQIIAAYARLTGWRSREILLSEVHTQLADVADEDYQRAIIRLWCQDMVTLAGITDGTVTGPDTLLTISASLLSTWADTHDAHPAVDGRPVFWRLLGQTDQLTYRDTGRAVDEPMPRYVILHVITDRPTYAAHLEESAAADPRWRDEMLGTAAEVRSGAYPDRRPYVEDFTDIRRAWSYATDLRRNHGGPAIGKTYEIAPVTGVGACEHCHQPVIRIDRTWRHKTDRFPTDCHDPFDGEAHTAAPRPPHGPITTPADPPSAAPGALAYAEDGGEHVWLLAGFGCNTELAGWETGKAKLWAADAIAAGDVDGLPAGMHVVGWQHHLTGGAEWATPLLGTGPGPARPDRDRDHPDRDHRPATPATVGHKIAPVVRVRDGITQIGTGTAPAAATGTTTPARTETTPAPADGTGTAIHYLIETRTATDEWLSVQTGTAPHAIAVPGPGDLENLADTIKSNVGFSIGTGTTRPDRPVRISTWTRDLPPAVLVIEPTYA